MHDSPPRRRRRAPSASSRRLCLWLAAVLAGAVAVAGCRPSAAADRLAADPLAADIERWSALLRNHPASDQGWARIEQSAQPGLEGAREALRHGRRLLALSRLASVRVDVGAATYVLERSPEQRRTAAGFEAEWTRMAGPLGDDLASPSPAALAGVRPAVARAMGEAALPQVRAYYQASLAYGQSTTPQNLIRLSIGLEHADDLIEDLNQALRG